MHARLEERVSLADEIVKEFLVRRGLVNTLGAFERDARRDALQGFKVVPPKLRMRTLNINA
jgi:hypothetical protein